MVWLGTAQITLRGMGANKNRSTIIISFLEGFIKLTFNMMPPGVCPPPHIKPPEAEGQCKHVFFGYFCVFQFWQNCLCGFFCFFFPGNFWFLLEKFDFKESFIFWSLFPETKKLTFVGFLLLIFVNVCHFGSRIATTCTIKIFHWQGWKFFWVLSSRKWASWGTSERIKDLHAICVWLRLFLLFCIVFSEVPYCILFLPKGFTLGQKQKTQLP